MSSPWELDTDWYIQHCGWVCRPEVCCIERAAQKQLLEWIRDNCLPQNFFDHTDNKVHMGRIIDSDKWPMLCQELGVEP